jgi:glycosyltransferase involved in cell wall biosynthesis
VNTPQFSVVIPLYNKAAEISRALHSVLRQTVQDLEVLVVNDGSTDNSRNVVAAVSDPRIRILDQANSGECAARNRGITEARSELIAFLDGDDEWLPCFLEIMARLTSSVPEAGAYAANYLSTSNTGVVYRLPKRGVPPHPWEGVLPDYFRTRNVLSSSSIVVRRDVFRNAGLFRVGLSNGGDLDMWLRIAARYPVAYSTHCGAVIHVNAPRPAAKQIELNSQSFLDRSMAEIESAADIPSGMKRRARNYVAARDLSRILLILSLDPHFDVAPALSRWRQSHGVTAKWLLCKLATFLPARFFRMLVAFRSFGWRAPTGPGAQIGNRA